MARLIHILIFVTCILAARTACGATYYIDCAGGSDNNAGTKTLPWQHAPGMPGFKASYSHATGDQIIFKGGVVCPVSYFPWPIANSGTSSAPDYYGVDQTWYAGASWTRPIFDGAGTGPNGHFVDVNGNYVTLDNIEIRNQGIPPVENFPAGQHMAVQLNGTNAVVKNFYIHGYKLTGNCVSGWWNGSSWTPASDYHDAGINVGPGDNQTIDHLTFDGSDSSPYGLGNALNTYASPLVHMIVTNSVIHDVSNAICCGGAGVIHNDQIYNVVQSCNSLQHSNAIEDLTSSIFMQIYDNVIHDVQTGVTLLICPNAAVYDNVFYNNEPWAIVFQDACGNDTTYTAYAYNNTIQTPPVTPVTIMVNNHGSGGIGGLVVVNNHLITDMSGADNSNGTGTICFNNLTGVHCDAAATVTIANNVFETNAEATASGYTSTQVHPFSPTSSGSPTVGAGQNLSSSCGSFFLCADILGVARPSSGAWDSGAYEFSQNTSGQPNPPTNLTAVVH
jgi:hypothetical protein